MSEVGFRPYKRKSDNRFQPYERKSKSFDEMINLCHQYEEITGRIIQLKSVYGCTPIGSWITTRLLKYKTWKLSLDELDKLKSLRTIKFWFEAKRNQIYKRDEKSFNYMFDLCLKYETEEKKIIMPDVLYKSANIGPWLYNQIMGYKAGKISYVLLNKLESLQTIKNLYSGRQL